MKENIHPDYNEVVFLDMSTQKKFLCRSTVKTTETTDLEGVTYPLKKVSISSDSHPFYTGDQTLVDTEGMVDKFKKKYAGGPTVGKKSAEAGAKAKVKPVIKAREKEEEPKKGKKNLEAVIEKKADKKPEANKD